MIKVLVTGSNGQLAFSIEKLKPEGIELICLDKIQFDLSKKNNIKKNLEDIKPDFIINCGAYTSVDKAESEKEIANAVNSRGPYYLAKYLKEIKGKLIQISTDFVFNGESN